MAYPGQDLKYRITTTKQDFMLSEGDFEIVIKNSWGRVLWRIAKEDCFYDTEGRWYFAMENAPQGVYTAIFLGSYEDEDYVKQERVFTDVQPLCIVDERGGKEYQPDASHDVQYEQIWTINVADGEYLADRDGNFVYTSDGQRISFSDRSSTDGKVRLSMTGKASVIDVLNYYITATNGTKYRLGDMLVDLADLMNKKVVTED